MIFEFPDFIERLMSEAVDSLRKAAEPSKAHFASENRSPLQSEAEDAEFADIQPEERRLPE